MNAPVSRTCRIVDNYVRLTTRHLVALHTFDSHDADSVRMARDWADVARVRHAERDPLSGAVRLPGAVLWRPVRGWDLPLVGESRTC